MKQIENQIRSVTKKPIRFLRLQGRACDWSKHNEHSRNIFSVHGFLRLSVIRDDSVESFNDKESVLNRSSSIGFSIAACKETILGV